MRKLAVALLLVAVASCGRGDVTPSASTPEPAPSTTDLQVSLHLYDNVGVSLEYTGHAFVSKDGACHGRHSFTELGPSHTTELRDAQGTVVATAPIEEGVVYPAEDGDPASCRFVVGFTDVPVSLDLFKVSVGGSTGGPTFTNADLLADDVGVVYNRPGE